MGANLSVVLQSLCCPPLLQLLRGAVAVWQEGEEGGGGGGGRGGRVRRGRSVGRRHAAF